MKHPNIKLSLYSYHNSSFSPSSSSSDVFFTILIKIYLIIQVETKADHEHRQESTDLSILAHHLQSIHATKENRVASSIGLLLNIGLPHTSRFATYFERRVWNSRLREHGGNRISSKVFCFLNFW